MDLCRTDLPSCILLQSVNFFMEKGIKQYTTGGRYVYIYCNDQGRSVSINAISEENGLNSSLHIKTSQNSWKTLPNRGRSFTFFCDSLSKAI